MFWVEQKDDTIMSPWLKEALDENCPTCGSPIANGYNDKKECTRRVCTNKQCPKTIAAKIASMCGTMDVAGIKEGVGYKMVKDYQLTDHLDAIPIIFKGEKPNVPLSMIFKFAFMYGVNDELDVICKNYTTVQEVMESYTGKYKEEMVEKLPLLKKAESLFNVTKLVEHKKEFTPIVGGVVVITGEIPGYEKREDFIPIVNGMFMGLTNFTYSPSKRKTGLFCCIAQDKSSTTGKISDAKSAGAPIYTQKEFMDEIVTRVKAAGKFDDYVKAFQERRELK